jgi:SHS2 domain-containing protein
MHPRSRTEEHVGEWKVTISADTLDALVAEVARVIASTGGRARGEHGGWEAITLTARDTATLLADWANELIGRSEIEGRIYDDTRVKRIDDVHLEAEVRGRRVDMWSSPLKAATYHGLELVHDSERWRLTMLMDV